MIMTLIQLQTPGLVFVVSSEGSVIRRLERCHLESQQKEHPSSPLPQISLKIGQLTSVCCYFFVPVLVLVLDLICVLVFVSGMFVFLVWPSLYMSFFWGQSWSGLCLSFVLGLPYSLGVYMGFLIGLALDFECSLGLGVLLVLDLFLVQPSSRSWFWS